MESHNRRGARHAKVLVLAAVLVAAALAMAWRELPTRERLVAHPGHDERTQPMSAGPPFGRSYSLRIGALLPQSWQANVVASYEPLSSVEFMDRTHDWLLTISTQEDEPVNAAEVTATWRHQGGESPPLQCFVSPVDEHGRYLIEGVRFLRNGGWRLGLTVTTAEASARYEGGITINHPALLP